jgi:tRNA(Arg) A34 adenosine deaminase TadA
MARAIDLAEANVAAGTGGPFGAAVYDLRSGRPVAAGANLVVFGRCACLHAEIVALALAQQRQGTHDLAAAGEFGLYTSTEPCAMCLGAVAWSGVRRLVCGASGGDAEAIGFDEGPKPAAWPRALRRRGIDVRRGVLRAAALDVLRRYRAAGGPIYNPGPRAAAGDRR